MLTRRGKKGKTKQNEKLIPINFSGTQSHLIWKEVKESGTFLQPLMFSKHFHAYLFFFHAYLFIESHCILSGELFLDTQCRLPLIQARSEIQKASDLCNPPLHGPHRPQAALRYPDFLPRALWKCLRTTVVQRCLGMQHLRGQGWNPFPPDDSGVCQSWGSGQTGGHPLSGATGWSSMRVLPHQSPCRGMFSSILCL